MATTWDKFKDYLSGKASDVKDYFSDATSEYVAYLKGAANTSTNTDTQESDATTDYRNALIALTDKQKADYQANVAANVATLNSQKPTIKSAYDTARSGAYTSSRVSALGNNEALASVGLAGSAYSAPRSGYSESSRIAQDIELQNTLNSLGAEERSAVQSLQEQIQALYNQQASDYATMDNSLYSNLASLDYTTAQNKEALEASQVEYISNLLDSGGTITDEQAAKFEKYTGVTTEQYQQIIEAQKTEDSATIATEIQTAIENGDTSVTLDVINNANISDEDKSSLIETYQTSQYNTLVNSLSEAATIDATNSNTNETNAVLESADSIYNAGEISTEQYNSIYATVYKSKIDTINTIEEYNAILTALKEDESLLGTKYNEINTLLQSKNPTEKYKNVTIVGAKDGLGTKDGEPIGDNFISYENFKINFNGQEYLVEAEGDSYSGGSSNTKIKEFTNLGLLPGKIILYDGKLWAMTSDGYKVFEIGTAEKAKDDYTNLVSAVENYDTTTNVLAGAVTGAKK